MIKEGRFGVQEAISLVTITISVKVYFTSPAMVAKIVGTSSWYMTLISAATAMLGFSFLVALLKRFPGKDLIEIFRLSLGRFSGMILSLALILFLLTVSGVLLREFAEVLKVYALPLTPPIFIIGAFLVATVIACFLGLEGIARAARLVAYFLLAGFLLVILMAGTNYDFHYLFPLLGRGLDTTVLYGLSRSSFYGEIILLGIIATSLHGVDHIKKIGYISLTISGLIVAIALAASMMAFNYGTSQEMVSMMYELSRSIHLGGFLQRLDPLFLFTWCLATVISVSFLQYCTLSAYCKTFRIQDMRALILPMTIILFTAAMIPEDLTTVMDFVQLLRQFGWIVYFGIPLIAWIAAALGKKKGETEHA